MTQTWSPQDEAAMRLALSQAQNAWLIGEVPVGAVITGGELIVETAFVGPTAHTLSLGIAGTLTALLNAVSLLATGRTALTLTSPLLSNAGQNLRLTNTYTVANATAGKARLRVQYTIDSRAEENVGA